MVVSQKKYLQKIIVVNEASAPWTQSRLTRFGTVIGNTALFVADLRNFACKCHFANRTSTVNEPVKRGSVVQNGFPAANIKEHRVTVALGYLTLALVLFAEAN